MKKKNILLEVYRILFTTIIILHHFRMYSGKLPFGGGYMATDFFFIVSGAFMLGQYEKNHERGLFQETWTYIRKRYVRLWIPLIVADLMLLVVRLANGYRIKSAAVLIKELFMIEIFTGECGIRFNPPTWFLGILLISSLVWYILLQLWGQKSRVIYAVTLCMIAGYACLIVIKGNGNIFESEGAVIDLRAMMRGLTGTGCGIAVRKLTGENAGSIRIKRIMACLMIPVYMYLLMWKDGYTLFDMAIYLMIVLSVWIILADKQLTLGKLDWIIEKLGKTSFYAFLVHYPLAVMADNGRIFGKMNWKIYSLIFLAGCWGIAFAMQYITEVITNKFEKRGLRNV